MVSETHMISLVPWIKQAIDEEISDKLMGDFMVELFGNGVIVSDAYSDACKGGSAKNANIKRRHDEIEKVWNKFFSEADEHKFIPIPGLEKTEDFYKGDDGSEEWDKEFRPDFMNEPEL